MTTEQMDAVDYDNRTMSFDEALLDFVTPHANHAVNECIDEFPEDMRNKGVLRAAIASAIIEVLKSQVERHKSKTNPPVETVTLIQVT